MPGLETLSSSACPVSCPISSVEVMPDRVSWSNRVKVVVDRRGKVLEEELDTKLSRAIICLWNKRTMYRILQKNSTLYIFILGLFFKNFLNGFHEAEIEVTEKNLRALKPLVFYQLKLFTRMLKTREHLHGAYS
jgi:hypothetical protein